MTLTQLNNSLEKYTQYIRLEKTNKLKNKNFFSFKYYT